MTAEEIEEKNVLLDAENQLQVVNDLPLDTQLKVAAKLLGYKKPPPDIMEFVEDEYYLGTVAKNLYPFWKEQLQDIFPTNIHTRYPILVITGSIGSGKSTFSRICSEYMVCRLDHLINPHRSMGMMPGKKIVFNYMMPTRAVADTEFPGTLNEWNQISPYFRQGMINGIDQYEFMTEGLIGKGAIGRDVIFYVLSELNFLPYDKAFEKLDTALKRWTSRFKRFTDYFGMMIIDTSSKNDDSIAEDFARNNPYGDMVKVIHTTEWLVKAHLNYYGRSGWFQVYKGDSMHSPFIVSESNPLTPELDKDLIINVPEELRGDFEFNLEKALMDQAGVSLSATDKFIPNFSAVADGFCLPKPYPDVIDVDFYDPNDKIIYQLEEGVRLIPTDRILFIHYDIGVVSDCTGIGISYFDSWKDYGVDKDNKRMRLPFIKTPIAIGIGRREEQETSIFKLQEFIIDLSDRFEVYFSADQFASRQLLQNLDMVGIPTKYISVDRTDQPYMYFKTLLNNHLWQGPKNERLITEVSELRRIGNKIDHPSTGSKDIADAVCGSIYNLYLNLDAAGQLSTKYIAQNSSSALADRAKRPSDKFQQMAENIFSIYN